MSSRLARQLALHGPEALLDEELATLVLGPRARVFLAEGRGHPRWRALAALARRVDARAAVAPRVTSARDAIALLGPRLLSAEDEELHVLALDARGQALACAQIARGGASQVAVTARDVFRPLVAAGATRAIVAHNHPSGDPTPSEADRELTVRLAIAGDLLGVVLLDHLVVAKAGTYSFAEAAGGLPLARRRRKAPSR